MKLLALIALALVACKKDTPKPAAPEQSAAADGQQEQRRCLRDAPSEDALDHCGDDGVPDDASEGTGSGKQSEAELYLHAIKQGARGYYGSYGAFPAGSAPLTPVDSCCASGRTDRKCEVDRAQWTSGADPDPLIWDELVFELDEPHYYRYAYQGTAAGFTAIAVGDLDCDDTFVTYTLEGSIVQGNPVFELTRPLTVE